MKKIWKRVVAGVATVTLLGVGAGSFAAASFQPILLDGSPTTSQVMITTCGVIAAPEGETIDWDALPCTQNAKALDNKVSSAPEVMTSEEFYRFLPDAYGTVHVAGEGEGSNLVKLFPQDEKAGVHVVTLPAPSLTREITVVWPDVVDGGDVTPSWASASVVRLDGQETSTFLSVNATNVEEVGRLLGAAPAEMTSAEFYALLNSLGDGVVGTTNQGIALPAVGDTVGKKTLTFGIHERDWEFIVKWPDPAPVPPAPVAEAPAPATSAPTTAVPVPQPVAVPAPAPAPAQPQRQAAPRRVAPQTSSTFPVVAGSEETPTPSPSPSTVVDIDSVETPELPLTGGYRSDVAAVAPLPVSQGGSAGFILVGLAGVALVAASAVLLVRRIG